MRCPFCQHSDSDVIDTRKLNSGETIRRRRKCASCGKRFTTYERVESVSLTVVKKNGEGGTPAPEKMIRGGRAGRSPRPGPRPQPLPGRRAAAARLLFHP